MLIARAKVKKFGRPAFRFSAIEDFIGLLYYKAKRKDWDMDCYWISKTTFQKVVRLNPSYFVFKFNSVRLAKGTSLQVLDERFCSYLNPEIHRFIQDEADRFFARKKH